MNILELNYATKVSDFVGGYTERKPIGVTGKDIRYRKPLYLTPDIKLSVQASEGHIFCLPYENVEDIDYFTNLDVWLSFPVDHPQKNKIIAVVYAHMKPYMTMPGQGVAIHEHTIHDLEDEGDENIKDITSLTLVYAPSQVVVAIYNSLQILLADKGQEEFIISKHHIYPNSPYKSID